MLKEIMKTYEAFISHASEDKENFVKPLAEFLEQQGLNIWYDEFALKIGDSLSESIDNGLAESKFAIVVFTKAYFEKFWTKEELKGIRALVSNNQTKILPIWLGVSREEVLGFSPILADIIAINANMKTIENIGSELIKITHPDLFAMINRRRAILKQIDESKPVMIPVDQIKMSDLRVKNLTISQISRVRTIRASLLEVLPMSQEQWEDGFKRDMHPEKEILWWECIASAYNEICKILSLNFEKKKKLFECMFLLYNNNDANTIGEFLSLQSDEEVEAVSLILNSGYEFLKMAFSNENRDDLYMPQGK